MELTAETLEHVARLARLDLSEDERETFHRDIVHVLDLFDALIDRPADAGREPASQLREDIVVPHEDIAALLANVPRLKDGRIDVGRSL